MKKCISYFYHNGAELIQVTGCETQREALAKLGFVENAADAKPVEVKTPAKRGRKPKVKADGDSSTGSES